MPVTKQKLIRHYALDCCLRNQTRRYYIEDLLAECNKALEAKDCQPVSLRTIKNDLNEFETLYNTIIAHIPDIKLNLRILQRMPHIILLLLIARKDAYLPNIAIQKAT